MCFKNEWLEVVDVSIFDFLDMSVLIILKNVFALNGMTSYFANFGVEEVV